MDLKGVFLFATFVGFTVGGIAIMNVAFVIAPVPFTIALPILGEIEIVRPQISNEIVAILMFVIAVIALLALVQTVRGR